MQELQNCPAQRVGADGVDARNNLLQLQIGPGQNITTCTRK